MFSLWEALRFRVTLYPAVSFRCWIDWSIYHRAREIGR